VFTRQESLRAKIGHILHPARIIVGAFLIGILIGGLLLSLPAASRTVPLDLLDAFFTATSAICVTGLIVVDTGSRFTLFGQAVILALIQIGGLGIMVFSSFIVILVGRNLSMRDRFMAKASLLGEQISYKNLFSVLKYIIFLTVLIESIGALCLLLRFWGIMPFYEALYNAVFHSISAYCNAGFALFPRSLIGFSGDIVINITIMALIVMGGLGFPVLYELLFKLSRRQEAHRFNFSLHFRIVIIASSILIISGAAGLFLLEIKNPLYHAAHGITALESLFQSVTARTAGFNTIDINLLSNPSLFLLIILMFIGGSPASTAGGIKTTTIVVFLALIRARFHGRERVDVYKRTIPNDVVYKVLSLIVGSLFFIIVVNIVLQITEAGFVPHGDVSGTFLMTLFETTSAFGTVGLSMGITSTLSFAGKCVIMLTMLVGRIGPMTFALAFIKSEKKLLFEYPEDSPMVG
jgi:trk system potassium uptake protein TrkH